MHKIIHLVLGKANPNRMNGVNKVAHYHATYLHKLGQDVEIWGLTRTPKEPVFDRDLPTRLFRSQPFFRGLDPSLMIAIERLSGNEVFHIHGALIPDFYLAAKLLVEKKIPYVYTPHGAFNEVALRKNHLLKKLYIAGFEKWILRNAKMVQFLGKSEYENISKIVTIKNKVIIPNGQNFEELNFKYESIHHSRSPVFGFCGRLDNYYKGLDLLIKAFASYLSKQGRGELWLIGDGPDRQKLEQLAIALNLGGRITFLGARYGEEKCNYLANMDVFVHPSHSEGSPTAVLEAAALGLPLLITTGTNMGDFVDQYHCGIHIANNDVTSIESALFLFEQLFEHGQLDTMKSASLNLIRNEFDWNIIAEKLTAIYNS